MSHMELAKQFLGYDEHDRKHAVILGNFFRRSIGHNINPADTAWCAAFVGSVLEASGVQSTKSLMARSYLKWGTPTDTPKIGDIVVFSRGTSRIFGHVGFFAGWARDGNILVLGGNQSDKVCIRTYSKERLLGFRSVPTVADIKRELNADN